MTETEKPITTGEDGASNLRAIFEILSYILVDAQDDRHTELAERIEFALNLAEKLIKQQSLETTNAGNADGIIRNHGSLEAS
jgi:hypothetical protein